MPEYAIYGKRTGMIVNGEPVFDKRFAALTYNGKRVFKLEDADTYATTEDAQEVLDRPGTKKLIDGGLCEFEIRRVN